MDRVTALRVVALLESLSFAVLLVGSLLKRTTGPDLVPVLGPVHGALFVALVLLAFVGGSTWRRYGLMSRTARRKAVLEGFAKIVGERALRPIEYTEHDWTHERWTYGSPVASMAPGALTTYTDALWRPFRRVHWAGTETSTYWTGYMDGAVRAGERAAVEVLERM